MDFFQKQGILWDCWNARDTKDLWLPKTCFTSEFECNAFLKETVERQNDEIFKIPTLDSKIQNEIQ